MKLPEMTIHRYADSRDPDKLYVQIILEDGAVFDTRTNAKQKITRGHDRHSALVEQALLAVWDHLGQPEE